MNRMPGERNAGDSMATAKSRRIAREKRDIQVANGPSLVPVKDSRGRYYTRLPSGQIVRIA